MSELRITDEIADDIADEISGETTDETTDGASTDVTTEVAHAAWAEAGIVDRAGLFGPVNHGEIAVRDVAGKGNPGLLRPGARAAAR